jgi:DNA-binding helix-hairpin-helix protein with protein kinase domain
LVSGLWVDGGVSVVLGAVLARAGEGVVYEVVGRSEWVAKIFHEGLKDRDVKCAKVAAMVGSPPGGAVQSDGFVVLTWPLQVVVGEGGPVGYVMRRIDTADAVEIHTVSNPSNRVAPLPGAPQWTPHVSWLHLVNVAANLCLAVDVVHRVDAVIGDFQERNILVGDTTRVSLVDCDSMQFTDGGGRSFLCGVGRAEFTAPELAGLNLAVVAREKPSDLFALAVHIHLLLMAGNHPFLRGVWTGPGEQPDALSLAKSGYWAGGPGSLLQTHPLAPSIDFLPDHVQRLFVRAFTEGAVDPSRRPSAAEWRAGLQALPVGTCGRGHQVPVETQWCPWCRIDDERAARKSQRSQDFTAIAGPQSVYKVTPPPQQPPPARPTSGSAGSGLKMAAVVIGALVAVAAIIAIIINLTKHDTPSTTATSARTSTTRTFTETVTTSTVVARPPTAATSPPGAKECGPPAGGRYAHTAAGSDLTSCPFALNVGNAVNESNGQFPSILQVYSPVTHQFYAMACAMEQVLTCRGGNNAVVYVY